MIMAFSFKSTTAVRKNVYAKIFLTGISGSGKSLSSLKLATGMADEIESMTGTRPEIALFNTESTRGLYYVDEYPVRIWPNEEAAQNITLADFTPELYVDYIKFTIKDLTVDGVPPIIIIDGATPAWEAMRSAHAKAGGAFKDWQKVTPRWRDFCNAIVQSKAHMIVCARGKSDYIIDGDKGKQTVRKVGIGADMRDGFDYEFTCAFNIDRATHAASVDKDNTKIFGTRNVDRPLTEEDGRAIVRWANSGSAKAMEEMHKNDNNSNLKHFDEDVVNLKDAIAKIKITVDDMMNRCNDEDTQKEMRKIVASTIKKYVTDKNGNPIADYRLVDSVDNANKILEELDKIGG